MPSITKTSGEIYRVLPVGKEPLTHCAVVAIEELKTGGTLLISCDYGSLGGIWLRIGDQSFKRFLCGLGKKYFLEHVTRYNHLVLDGEKTFDAIASDIKVLVDNGKMQEHAANHHLDMASPIKFMTSKDFMYLYASDASFFSEVYKGEFEGIPTVMKLDPQLDEFWNQVWTPLCETWKQELNKSVDKYSI